MVKNGLFSSKVTFFETLAAKQQDLSCDLRHIEGRLNVRLKAEKLYFLNLEKYFAFDPFLYLTTIPYLKNFERFFYGKFHEFLPKARI